MAIAAAEPMAAAVSTWARGLATLPAAQTPGTLVRPEGSVITQPSSSLSQPRPVSRVSWATMRGKTNTAARATTWPSASSTPRSRSPSTTRRLTVLSMIGTPRAVSRLRSSPVTSRVCGKKTTSSDHCRTSSAWPTEAGPVPSTPSGWSRTS